MNNGQQKLSRSESFIERLNQASTTGRIGRKSSRGVVDTIGGQAAKFALRFGSTAILARILAPEDYGIVAMALVVMGFIAVFKDAGLSYASIQKEKISHDQVSNLFWVNAALSFLIVLLLLAISPAIGMMFGDPRVSKVVQVLVLGFLFSGGSVQHLALLRRAMRFRTLVVLDLAAILSGLATAIVMASYGWGYWSLVWMHVVTSFSGMLIAWASVPWWPKRPRSKTGTLSLINFGKDILAFNAVNYFARRADDLLIGLIWGPAALGYYEKAYSLLKLPITQINQALNGVAIPALSRLKDNRDEWKSFFLNCYELVASASVPIVVFVAFFADQIVLVWLGEQWLRTAEIFRFLAVAALAGALMNPMGWVLVSTGQSRRYRNCGIANSIMVVIGFLCGVPFSEAGVAIGYSVVCLLTLVPVWRFALVGSGLSLKDLGTVAAFPLVSSIGSGLAAYALSGVVGTNISVGIGLLLSAAAFGVIYLLLLLVAFGRWRRFKLVLDSLR